MSFLSSRGLEPILLGYDLVFVEGREAALNLHMQAALSGTTVGHAVQWPEGLKPRTDAVSSSFVQSGAFGCVVGGAGLEPAASSV
jgi:hypothetical protein